MGDPGGGGSARQNAQQQSVNYNFFFSWFFFFFLIAQRSVRCVWTLNEPDGQNEPRRRKGK